MSQLAAKLKSMKFRPRPQAQRPSPDWPKTDALFGFMQYIGAIGRRQVLPVTQDMR